MVECFELGGDSPALSRLSNLIVGVFQQTGESLQQKGKKDLAELIWEQVSLPHSGAADLVKVLVEAIPAFADIHWYKGKEIHILKKAQLLCADLERHLGARYPAQFHFHDVAELTVMSDNVLPAVLRKFGILKLSESLSKRIDHSETLPPGDEEVELRALAVNACEKIVSVLKSRPVPIVAMDLDFYLWCKGKDPTYRSVERHSTTETIFY